MNTLKGPFKVVVKEMNLTFYINVGITIALFLLYIFLSAQVGGDNMLGFIFGPFYIVFLIYPFIFFRSYKFILSLGGTRKQFMMTSFIATFLYLVMASILLTVLHYIGDMMLQDGYIFHMADILGDANPVLYFWVDFLWMFTFFGIGMFAQAINFNLGTLRTLILAAVILLGSISAYFFIDLTPFFEFFITDYMLVLHLFAAGALLLLVFSYF